MLGNNNFGSDNYSGRVTRLNKLSDQIRAYADELEIPAELLNWAENSYNNFNNAANQLDIRKMDIKHVKYALAKSDKKLILSYQNCKNILHSRFRDDDRLAMFGISGATPKEHTELASAAAIMLRAIAEMQTEGMTDIMPEIFRLPVEENLAEASDNFYKIGVLEEKVAKARRQYEEIFQQDTRKLRMLYNLVIGYCGRNSPDLPIIGFAIDNKKRGRKRVRKIKTETEEIK